MRSPALLRLVWGRDFWKSVRAASSWCFGRHGLEHWYFYLRSNFPHVSVPLGIGLCWVFPFWNLEMWLCWNDEGDWWRGGPFFHFRVLPGYRQSIAGNTWVVLPCLVLSLLLVLLLLLPLLLLLLLVLLVLLLTFPLPSCVRYKGLHLYPRLVASLWL